MAKSRTQKRQSEESETKLLKRREAIRLFCGLLFLLLAAYTLISIISYLFTWREDQNTLLNGSVMDMNSEISNNGGRIGAAWADLLVSKLFGLSAAIIPFFFLGIALIALKIRKISILKLIFTSLYGCIIVSLALSFIFSFTEYNLLFGGGAGGSYGYYMNIWMIEMVGVPGTAFIIALLFIVWILCSNKRATDAIDRFFTRLGKPAPAKATEPTDERALQNGDEQEIEMALPEQLSEQPDIAGAADAAGIAGVEGIEGIADVNESAPEAAQPTHNMELEILSSPEGISSQEAISSQESGSAEESKDSDEAQEEQKNIQKAERTEEEEKDPYEKGLEEMDPEELNALFDPRLDLSSYQAPPITLLNEYKERWFTVSKEELERNKIQIVRALNNYKITISKISARIGPTVTLYEVVPGPGVRVSQIKRLEQDIQRSLAAKGVRVVTLIGTNAVGIEVANEKPSTVSMRSCLEDAKFRNADYDLPVAIGKSITNEIYSFDLAKMPHLLVAGATGQGKSVGLNAILASLLYRKHPSELKLVLVDPKKVELSLYSKIEKHFLAQLPGTDDSVVTDTQKVIYTLKSLCKEMDNRYDLLKIAGVRNIKEYNEKFLQRRLNPLKGHHFLPFIVVVIDEFADMILTAGREIEEPIARLAQLARAIGIHLVIATQRPTTSVITGNIKANFPARIAFMVRSSIDSRTILDEVGANQLIGRGDMLISYQSELTRLQCAFIDTEEVERIVDFIGDQRGYPMPYQLPEYDGEEGDGNASVPGAVDLSKRDEFFEDAAKLLVMHNQGSTSLIQRKLNLGYARSGRIMDQLEVAGIVGPFEGSKARQVLISDLTELDAKLENIKSIYG